MPETRVSSLPGTTESAQRLASGTLVAADAAGNEANLRHEVELLLRTGMSSPWYPLRPLPIRARASG